MAVVHIWFDVTINTSFCMSDRADPQGYLLVVIRLSHVCCA